MQIKQDLSMVPKTREEIKNIIDSYYSYENILKKIENLNDKIDSLHMQHKHIPSEIEELKMGLKNAPRKQDLDEIRSLIPKTVSGTETDKLVEISERLKGIEQRSKSTIREKMVQRLTKNSKDYVKTIILNLIRKYEKMPALKIKEMVVDEQGLCSKSSFYRLLAELEQEDKVNYARKGKEKIYIFKAMNKYKIN